MKRIALILLFTLPVIFICPAQENHSLYSIKQFIVLYTLGKNWDASKPAGEQAYFSEHSAHLAKLRKEKKIRIGARYGDTGMIVLRAGTEEEARGWVEADPAIQNKLFKVELFEMSPFYHGCID